MSTTNLTGQIKNTEKEERLFNAYSVIFYFTGSIITLEPESEGLPEFCSTGMLRNLPVTSMNTHFNSASEYFKAPCTVRGNCQKNVTEYYQRLFGDRESSAAWPVESSWPSANDRILHMIHGTTGDFYSRYAFRPDNDRRLPADHLGIELLFFNNLLAAFLRSQDPVITERIRKDLIGFAESHLLNWLPSWVKAVTDNSGTKCYKGVALLILGSVEDVKSLLID